MMLLKRSLAIIISAVGVATLPGWSIRYPPTVNLFLFFSFLFVHTLQTNFLYVTYFLQLFGMSFLRMSVILLVGFYIRPSTPSARGPNSFTDDMLQFFLFFGSFINCLYLRSLPVSASITSNAWWASFSNCVMWVVSRHMCLLAVNSTDDARPFCFLLSICSNRVRAIVLLDGSASALRFFIFCCALVRLLLLKLSLWLYTNIFYFSVLVPVIFPPLELLVWIFSKTVWRPVSLILFYRSHCCCCSSSP